MEYNAERLYANIRKLCRSNNVPLGKLETEIGLRYGYFSRMPKRRIAPRVHYLMKICDKFNITMDSLLTEEMKTYKERAYENQLEQLNVFYKQADGELKETLKKTIDDMQALLEKERKFIKKGD